MSLLSFTQYLVEASLMKVDAFLRNHPSTGLQPGYVSVNEFLGPRAAQPIVDMGMQILDRIKAQRIDLPVTEYVTTAKLTPLQYAVYYDDVKDIARKRAFDKPIQVMRYRGRLFILNGTHRAAAASIVGRNQIAAQVIDAPACFAPSQE